MNQSKRDSVNAALREKYPALKSVCSDIDFTNDVGPLMPLIEALPQATCFKRPTSYDRWEARLETRQGVMAYGDTLAIAVCYLLLEV